MLQNRNNLRPFFVSFALLLCQGISANAQTVGFTAGYEIEAWSKTDILDGTTEILSTTETEAQFKYTVRRSGGGVTNRTADYTITVPESATITFDWLFTGNHRWFMAFEEFHVIVNGEIVESPLSRVTSSGNFSYSGFDQIVSVTAGDTFGFRIGGENFDSNSNLDGLLTINNFRVEETTPPSLDLVISNNDATPGTFDFSWESRSGKFYDLLSSTDLSDPVENWTVWNELSNLPGSGTSILIQGAAPQESKRFFIVVEKAASSN